MTGAEKRAVKQFEKARKKLAQAERSIAKVFQPRLTAACKANDLKELQQMIWDIPEQSRHKVRIYQAILEIEKETKKP